MGRLSVVFGSLAIFNAVFAGVTGRDKRNTECSGRFGDVEPSRLQTAIIDGSCVYLIDHTYSFPEARALCKGEGTQLVQVQDPAKQQAIEEAFGFSQYWIGLEKIKGAWQWVGLSGQKEPMVESRWENDFTPTDILDVVAYTTSAMKDGTQIFQWKAARTNFNYRPVCEVPVIQAAPCPYTGVEDCVGKFQSVPADRLMYTFISGVCVYMIDHPYTYSEAESMCQREGTHLVHVKEAEKQQAIVDEFDRSQFWTGLKKVGGEWQWMGLDDVTEPVTTPRWENGFPPSDSNDKVSYTTTGHSNGEVIYTWKGGRPNYSYRPVCQTVAC